MARWGFALFLCAGCSGSSVATVQHSDTQADGSTPIRSGTGGATTGTGGANTEAGGETTGSGGAAGTGGRATTPPAQGAMVETVSPNASSTGCPSAGPTFVSPPYVDPVSGTSASLSCDLGAGIGCRPDTNVVVDGSDGASVKCAVSGSDPYTVNASLSQGIVAFTVRGSLSASGGKAFVSSTRSGANVSDPQCDIFIEANKGEIKSGAVWARFDCEQAGDPTVAANPGCTATGYFLFENCAQ